MALAEMQTEYCKSSAGKIQGESKSYVITYLTLKQKWTEVSSPPFSSMYQTARLIFPQIFTSNTFSCIINNKKNKNKKLFIQHFSFMRYSEML